MTLIAFAIVAGILGGYVRGGSLGRFPQLRMVWILVVAIVSFFTDGVPPAVYFVLGSGWVAINLPHRSSALRTGLVVIFIGCCLNGLVILANGKMPVSATLVRDGGGATPSDRHHEPMTSATRLRWLGDDILVPGAVVSIGDLALAAGVMIVVLAGMDGRDVPAL